MKIKSSLKSLKKRDLNSKLVRRRGRVYIINKTNPKFKARQKQIFMDDQSHKSTWKNFTKFVLWGTVAVIGVLVLMAIFLLQNLLYENCFNFRKSKNREKNSNYT